MKKEELIGKKVRGFRFEKIVNSVWYMADQMDKYVGKEGVIIEYDSWYNSYGVKFEDGMSYHYPAERIEHHLVVEEPTIEVNYNYISVRICDDNSLIGYYTDDCGITSFGKTFDELLRNLQHAKKAIEEAREKLKKEDESRYLEPTEENLKEFEKSLDQSAEEFINDANKHIIVENPINTFCESKNSNCRLNYCDENGCQERQRNLVEPIESLDPLDDLPMIGDGVLMEVSDNEENWFKYSVIGRTENGHFLTIQNGVHLCTFIHARPIAKTKITRKEFEQKFEIID
jgi:predicted RNase H-like HicB family nuclease